MYIMTLFHSVLQLMARKRRKTKSYREGPWGMIFPRWSTASLPDWTFPRYSKKRHKTKMHIIVSKKKAAGCSYSILSCTIRWGCWTLFRIFSQSEAIIHALVYSECVIIFFFFFFFLNVVFAKRSSAPPRQRRWWALYMLIQPCCCWKGLSLSHAGALVGRGLRVRGMHACAHTTHTHNSLCHHHYYHHRRRCQSKTRIEKTWRKWSSTFLHIIRHCYFWLRCFLNYILPLFHPLIMTRGKITINGASLHIIFQH